ncbi:hypothetical protein GCM10027614_22870 [Micromonospora vulcania]
MPSHRRRPGRPAGTEPPPRTLPGGAGAGPPELGRDRAPRHHPGPEALLGREHRNTLASRHKLARTILEQGRWRDAEDELQDIVQAEYRVRGPEDRDTMTARHSLARAIVYQGRYDEAHRAGRDPGDPAAALGTRPLRDPDGRHTLDPCRLRQGEAEEALADLREILSTDSAKRQVQHVAMIAARHTLAECLIATGATVEAEKVLVGVVEDRRRILGDDHADTVRAETDPGSYVASDGRDVEVPLRIRSQPDEELT